jgi:DNA primase
MDILQLYEDFGIPYLTEGNKHCHDGWVQVCCPFCQGSSDYHLGYNFDDNYFNCYRCGHHSVFDTIQNLTVSSPSETKLILAKYKGQSFIKTQPVLIKFGLSKFKLPSHTTELQKQHKRYLEKRNFDPDKLEKIWGLKGTGPISTLENNKKTINYSHRIIIPFEWDGKIVSFDSRDITGKTSLRYIACPKEREIIPHKNILYGKQSAWKETGICVEGPTDAWRFGERSFAVSGIEYKVQQIRMIAKYFKRVFVCFDDEAQAVKQAKELISDLRFRNVDAIFVPIVGDPGSMEQSEADYLVKQLIK